MSIRWFGHQFAATPALTFMIERSTNADIYLMDVISRHLLNLTHNPGNDRAPAWAADGQRLAFLSDRDGATQLHVLALPSRARAVLPTLPIPVAPGYHPLWSPDGRYLLLELSHAGNTDLYRLDADCLSQIESCPDSLFRLTDDPTDDRFPAWSPDGRAITFVSWRLGDAEIFAMASDGSDVRNLTSDPGWDVSPSWSSNGDQIAFFSDRAGSRDLYVMRPDGSHVQRIFDSPSLETIPRASALAWSPDGSKLAFSTVIERNADIIVVCVDVNASVDALCARPVHRITEHAATDYNPIWSPDGRALYFISDRLGRLVVFRVDLACLDCPPAAITSPDDLSGSPSWRP